MGLVWADLTDDLSPDEYASRKEWLDRTSSNDIWAKKIFKKIGILITSHQANRPYLRASIESHAKLGYWITLAYDNYVHPQEPEINHNNFMPGKETLDLVDTFIMPHYQVWGGVLYPYFWLLKFGTALMQDFEYIYCTNGDFVLDKPEGFEELFSLIGDADIMTSGPDYEKAANTAGFIVKSKALKAIVQHWQDHFIPFEVYEKYTQDIGNAEGRFGKAIKDLGLKQVIVTPPIGEDGEGDDMFRHSPEKRKQNGTWYDLIGFRHIHSEHNFAYRNKGIPPHYKYLDERFMGDEFRVIKEYYETGNLQLIQDWWAKE
jgi:hypothetical protein